jgi:hypothetical protein
MSSFAMPIPISPIDKIPMVARGAMLKMRKVKRHLKRGPVLQREERGCLHRRINGPESEAKHPQSDKPQVSFSDVPAIDCSLVLRYDQEYGKVVKSSTLRLPEIH